MSQSVDDCNSRHSSNQRQRVRNIRSAKYVRSHTKSMEKEFRIKKFENLMHHFEVVLWFVLI